MLLTSELSSSFGLAWLLSVATSLLVRYHPLPNLADDRQELLGSPLDVAHRLFQLVDRAEVAKALH